MKIAFTDNWIELFQIETGDANPNDKVMSEIYTISV